MKEDDQERILNASLGHRGFALVGAAFIVFEIFFLTLYTEQYWFGVNLVGWGILAILIALAVAHVLLRWLESPTACRLFSPVWKGAPPIVYCRWVVLNKNGYPPGIAFGNRYVSLDAIDELELSLFGNLVIRSWRLRGEPLARLPRSDPHKEALLRRFGRRLVAVFREQVRPDLILKLPLGAALLADQKFLIAYLQQHNPNIVLNSRLQKHIQTVDVKGSSLVQPIGAAMLCVVLLDLGDSTFRYVQMLKCYYQTQVDARSALVERGSQEYELAERIRLHPIPLSWVTTKLVGQAGFYEARAEALWSLNRRHEAIESINKAIELSPKSFRYNLKAARWLTQMGDRRAAIEEIQAAIRVHKDSFLPRLYMLALKAEQVEGRSSSGSSVKSALSKSSLQKKDGLEDVANIDQLSVQQLYQKYLASLDEEVFGEEPAWPPGGNRFLHDVWYRDDVQFVFSRLLR